MKCVTKVSNKTINIFYDVNIKCNEFEVVILNTYSDSGSEIWNKVKLITDKKYILVTISNINWNKDLSPWYMNRLYKNDQDYSGDADLYINDLANVIIPKVNDIITNYIGYKVLNYILAGYSLAGLFAIYSLYKTNIFSKIVSCSGSFWYPNFVKFVQKNKLSNIPNKVYFSLGNKEHKTNNVMMSKVKDNTLILKELYDNYGINTIYEENEGNHFKDINNRIAKGISSILD